MRALPLPSVVGLRTVVAQFPRYVGATTLVFFGMMMMTLCRQRDESTSARDHSDDDHGVRGMESSLLLLAAARGSRASSSSITASHRGRSEFVFDDDDVNSKSKTFKKNTILSSYFNDDFPKKIQIVV